ncbi:hypothetical protein HZU77_015020 [Neisseriaceae bacterium TC5R-5]|nr:hypothetical protein [Neisseriaceae bacterium TC5R-5]
MIHFPVLRTQRFTLQLKELSLGESITLAAIPLQLEEAACTAFLRYAIETVQGISNPADWTVQERTLALCHYLAATDEDSPNFTIGPAHYADYLDNAPECAPERVTIGEVATDYWHLQQLTGAMAESIERLQGELDSLSGHLHWLVGCMAAQLVREGEVPPAATAEGAAYDAFLLSRMRILLAYPHSDFMALMVNYQTAREQLHHLLRLELGLEGLVVMPKGGAANDLPPARFPVRTSFSAWVCELVNPLAEPGRQPQPLYSHATGCRAEDAT